ncbi:hypothetical protein CY34DRAFT_798330 [Suillus luteus UH-Slu-Lm8-n1]|uniref:Uncharacterized protein n=1 Tax=Suillus luteus UH-Slu-Lm8-n1 TaxID=930992 RepID=A0A0D0BEL1_9AGAM|nr:hypothetical protein CY34DRAFT_798330 [Suillus luteus UH-Slu-Lm8-n1]
MTVPSSSPKSASLNFLRTHRVADYDPPPFVPTSGPSDYQYWLFTMSSHTLPKSFAVKRSYLPASSDGKASIKKSRPILRDLRNTLALQAIESSRYSIEQGGPFDAFSFSVTESPTSSEHVRHNLGNGKNRISPIALPVTSHTAPSLDMLECAPVDALAFHVSNRDTSAEEENVFGDKRSPSMIVSYSDHGNPNIDNTPEFKHAAIYHCIKPLNLRSAPLNYRAVNQTALVFSIPPCSPTLPLSPPTASSSPISDLLSKRSGRMFRLVPTENDCFMHAVATDLTDYHIESPLESPCSYSPTQIGFPPDMLALLQELDELAAWVQDFPHPEEVLDIPTIGSTVPVSYPHALQRLGNDLGDHFPRQPVLPDKGKKRRLTDPTDDISECQLPTSHSPISPVSTPITRRRSARYIYQPQGTPSFLVGSSTSLIAYPAEGYLSPPREVIAPGPFPITGPASTPIIRACGRRSVPNVSPPPLVSPPTGMTSFKAFFKRSRSNTMSAPRCGREKKKFGWLKI